MKFAAADVDGYWLGHLEFTGIVLAADPVSARVSHFKGNRSLNDVRSLGHIITLSRRVQPVSVRKSSTLLVFNHNTVFDTASPSMLQLPAD